MTDLEAQLAATRRDLRDRDCTIHQLVNENRELRARLAAAYGVGNGGATTAPGAYQAHTAEIH